MRTKVALPALPHRSARLTGQLSLVALLAGLGAGCSSMSQITGPMFTGSTNNQKQIIGSQADSQPAYAQAGSSGVQSNDLAPPPGATANAYAPAPAWNGQGGQGGYQPQVAAAPKPYQPPKPYAASGLPQPMGAVGGASERSEVASAPSRRAPGQTLAQLGAPPSSLGDQAARIDGGVERPAHGGSGAYTVQPGDTMYGIARRNGVSVNELMAANGGSATAKLGQRLRIPGGGDAAPSEPPARIQLASVNPRETPDVTPAVIAPPLVPQDLASPAAPAAPPLPAASAQPAAPAAPPLAATPSAPAVSNSDGSFRWPVHGRVISGFGKKADGERNDGINMAVPEGTAVKAAEDGTVIYAGSELKSYGNLVLIRHANGWVSAYAHNSELKVKRGEQVRRGQTVAASGMSGGVTTPQVHFELRKDATPVDPLQHMAEG